MEQSALIRAYEPRILELRREFHRHPELSGQEAWTCARICAELDSLGIPHVRLSDGVSVVGRLDGSGPGRRIALRADIDALPVQEQTGAPYASEQPGLMHACGHDAHIAMLLGAAMALRDLRESLRGSVFFCFQSGEEVGHGAGEVLGYLREQGGVDQVIGLHIWGSLPEGTLQLLDGPTMSGCLAFDVRVRGRGGHGSRPDQARDPIKPACDLVLKMASIPVNFYDALSPCVLHTGTIRAGTMRNIFPEEAYLGCGLRYFKPDGLEEAMGHVERMADGVGRTYGVEISIQRNEHVPPVINSPQAAARGREVAAQVEGLTVDAQSPPICASDNFGCYLQEYPGFYAFLGGRNEERGLTWPQHHCKFDVDEAALRKGSEFFVRYAAAFLK